MVWRPDMERPPAVWEYEVDGWLVWAGRTARDNDHLSLKVARNDDWWFHVSGTPGSHVVLFVREGIEPPAEVVKAAASIAAYHSKQRGGGTVGVSGTRARHVSKVRGDRPGTVHIRKQRVFKVKPRLPE